MDQGAAMPRPYASASRVSKGSRLRCRRGRLRPQDRTTTGPWRTTLRLAAAFQAAPWSGGFGAGRMPALPAESGRGRGVVYATMGLLPWLQSPTGAGFTTGLVGDLRRRWDIPQ